MMNDRIELKATKLPEEISAIRCVVCARVSERPLMAATGEAEGEDIVICPRCLSEGDIDAKLEHLAAELDERARWLRALVGRLEVPSRAVLKEFARPEDIEQAALFWDSLSDLLKESEADQSGGSSSGEPAAGISWRVAANQIRCRSGPGARQGAGSRTCQV